LQALVDFSGRVIFALFDKGASAVARATVAIGATISRLLVFTGIVGGGDIAKGEEEKAEKGNQENSAQTHGTRSFLTNL
jgi:hypothetical protein